MNLMPFSNSILRRYTPPTCTLEIVAKSSPLSRWLGQSVLKELRFELRFDDPRKSEDERVTIRGNAGDLEVLCDAVSNYVQNFLDLSSMPLPGILHNPTAGNSSTSNDESTPDSISYISYFVKSPTLIAPDVSQEEPDESSSDPDLESNSKIRQLKPRTSPSEIYLKPRGLLNHNLFLGQLATDESGSVVDLSALQLFDLATALDEYAAELVALPNLNPLTGRKAPPAWTRVAAVAVLAVGVTTAGIKFLSQPYEQQQTASKANQQLTTPEPTPIPAQVPLLPTPAVSPLATPAVPPLIAASPTLPPPTPVQAPAQVPSSQASNLPPVPQRPSLSIEPTDPRRGAIPQPALPAPPSNQIASLPAPAAPSASNPLAPSTNPQTQTNQSTIPTTPFPLPKLPPLNSTRSAPAASDRLVEPQITVPSSVTSGNLTQAGSAPANDSDNSRLFDNIPQVAEVRNYLQQRWKPPSGLTKILEYTVWLDGDGSVLRIEPRGQAAIENIDRTAIPRQGEPFVSPVEGGRNPKIRVVFTPNGRVETFLEEME